MTVTPPGQQTQSSMSNPVKQTITDPKTNTHTEEGIVVVEAGGTQKTTNIDPQRTTYTPPEEISSIQENRLDKNLCSNTDIINPDTALEDAAEEEANCPETPPEAVFSNASLKPSKPRLPEELYWDALKIVSAENDIPPVYAMRTEKIRELVGNQRWQKLKGKYPKVLYEREEWETLLLRFGTRLEEIDRYRQEAQDALLFSQFTVAKYFDKCHQRPTFKTGDMVYLNIAKKHAAGYALPNVASKKLGPQRSSPFRIEVVYQNGRAAKLAGLPPSSGIHPVVSCIHLETANEDVRLDRPTAEPIYDFDTEETHLEFEVEMILQKKIDRGIVEYLVKWKGWPIEEATWEPKAHLEHARELVQSFEDR